MKTPVRTRLLSALLSLVMLVSLLPVSVFAAEPASGTWEKVTEAQEDWSGQYLIVYEKGSLIMDGSLSALDKEGNKVDVTITDGKIVGDYAKYAFTIAPMTGGWSVQSASGKYISGKSGSNKIITGSTPELNTITFADGNVKIASNNTTLQYNAAATNGTRFRYYKSENQQPVALYKLSTVPARESGIVTDLTTLQNGDKVVVFNPANKKALSSVYNGFYNTGVDVELTGGKLTGYTDAELWTVNRTESGAYTFSTADGKKLSMDTSYSRKILQHSPGQGQCGLGAQRRRHGGLLLHQERGPRQLSGVVRREEQLELLRNHRQQRGSVCPAALSGGRHPEA